MTPSLVTSGSAPSVDASLPEDMVHPATRRNVRGMSRRHATHHHRGRSWQPSRASDRRNSQDARTGDGPTHSGVGPRGARRGRLSRKDVLFICGYRAEVISERYPEFTYVENRDWENNNILLSLMTAREHLRDGFVSTYADIIYRGAVVSGLVASPHDKVLGCDTDWRRRYVGRTRHPETDAEKMRAEGSKIIELSRTIASEAAAGEFIGVTKFTRRRRRRARRRVRRRPCALRRAGVPRETHLREGLPHRSLPRHDRKRVDLPPRGHPRRLHGDRHAAGRELRRVVVEPETLSPSASRSSIHREERRRGDQMIWGQPKTKPSGLPASAPPCENHLTAKAASRRYWGRSMSSSAKRKLKTSVISSMTLVTGFPTP